jgi:D-3-phosphoglycerate dehydrogenase
VEYSGEITGYDLSLLRSHVLKGILYQEPKVNIVNAHLVAKEQGIDIRERRHGRAGQYSNLITVEVKGQSTVQAGGTLTQNQEERIVQIDGFSVEAVPKGFLLITHNEDEPGIIGHIGTVLGRRGINIASMTLGRKKKGGPAITVLNLDAGLDETALKEIKELPVIHAVSLVRL